MDHEWELWDTESSNLIGTYATKDEALAVVHATVLEHGAQEMAFVALGQELDDGTPVSVAKGMALVLMARRRLGVRASVREIWPQLESGMRHLRNR